MRGAPHKQLTRLDATAAYRLLDAVAVTMVEDHPSFVPKRDRRGVNYAPWILADAVRDLRAGALQIQLPANAMPFHL